MSCPKVTGARLHVHAFHQAPGYLFEQPMAPLINYEFKPLPPPHMWPVTAKSSEVEIPFCTYSLRKTEEQLHRITHLPLYPLQYPRVLFLHCLNCCSGCSCHIVAVCLAVSLTFIPAYNKHTRVVSMGDSKGKCLDWVINKLCFQTLLHIKSATFFCCLCFFIVYTH